VTSRTYLSIGDVLGLLRQEFPDVTISKIRFLESQGLVNPERTPSGYRKFYDSDVDRLRWVLRQQREHFLPLKVIKGRLEQEGTDEGDGNGHDGSGPDAGGETPARPEPALVGKAAPTGGRGGQPVAGLEGGAGARPRHGSVPGRDGGSSPAAPPAATGRAAATATVVGARPAGPGGRDRLVRNAPAGPAPGGAQGGRVPSSRVTPSGTAPAGRAAATSERAGEKAAPQAAEQPPVATLSGTAMTAEELAEASGLDAPAVQQLESYGLVTGRVVGGTMYFDEEAIVVARLAAGFATFGVEARHLRLHKHAAEREAGFIEQIVLPVLKQRNPEARRRALDTVAELSRLGQGLREALLRNTLRDQLGG